MRDKKTHTLTMKTRAGEEELLLCRYAEAMLIRGEQQLKRNEEERLRAQRAW